MQFELICIFEGNKFLSEAVLIVTDVMRDLVVYLEAVVVFVVAVSFLLATDVADHMLEVDMYSKLVLVEKVAAAETAVRVQEGDVSELVDVSLLHVLVEGLVGV
jgi:hypothetical protein